MPEPASGAADREGMGPVTLPEAATPAWFQWLNRATDAEKSSLVASMDQAERNRWRRTWPVWARRAQLPPEGDWLRWLILAGRGFGKTRAGAEWVQAIATADGAARIALVGASLGEARAIMVEGESGLRRIAPPGQEPHYESSLRRLTWPSGAQATLFSAGEPESLRGPQHSHACGPGAEGGLRQPGAVHPGWPAALRHRGRGGRAPGRAGRRHRLDRGHRGERRLGGLRWPAGVAPDGTVAVRAPA